MTTEPEPLGRVLQIAVDVAALEWMDRALCAEVDPTIFHVDKGGSTREAKLICSRCTVREACLAFALDSEDEFGVYGGLSARQRRDMKRASRKAAA
jgi:WhiB family transcriptional regulator, redox-sensing transcriptional regulator